MLDSLESRYLLSASLVNHQLIIQGTNGADQITLTTDTTNLQLNDNGQITSWELSQINSISAELYDGNDQFNMAGVNIVASVMAGAGDDTITGGSASDTILGEAGNDSLMGGPGKDSISGGFDNDTLRGGWDDDFLRGGIGDDLIIGGDGNDFLFGGEGDDTLMGGMEVAPYSGTLYPAWSGWSDTLGGGTGIDTADYSDRTATVVISLDGFANDGAAILNADGSLQKSEGDNVQADIEIVIGGSGNDMLFASNTGSTLIGGPGNDTLQGGSGNDKLEGGLGKDLLMGGPGNDSLYGQEGQDTLKGGSGDDSLDGGQGMDSLFGGAGNDDLYGGSETPFSGMDTLHWTGWSDTLIGSDGIDTAHYEDRTTDIAITLDDQANDGMQGELDNVSSDIEIILSGAGNDYLSGSSAANTIWGGAGNDTLIGEGGNDVLHGDSGDDVLNGGTGSDQLIGGDGIDLADYSDRTQNIVLNINGQAISGSTGENDTIATDIENIRSGSGNDRITGSNSVNMLEGGAGNDTIFAVGTDDTIRGGAGDDLLTPSLQTTVIIGGNGNDTADFSARTNDLIITLDDEANDGASGENSNVMSDVETVLAGSGNDFLVGSSVNNRLEGRDGKDTLQGMNGNDTLDGGTGDDLLLADAGSDVIKGGDGSDTADYSTRTENLRITLDDVANDGASGENDNVASDIETLMGGSGNDFLGGSDAPNVIYGNAGDDTLDGGWGNDTLWGGDGFDMADYSSRSMIQQLRIGEGSGIPGEQDIPELDIEGLIGGSGPDWIQGSSADNLLIGNGGNDTIIGLAGNDTLIGGLGADNLGHDSSGQSPPDSDLGDDTIYTNVPGNNNDGSIDIINDTTGTNTLHYSTTDPDTVP